MRRIIVNSILVISIIAAVLVSCAGKKSDVKEQKKSTGTVAVKASEKPVSTTSDIALDSFAISIDGYKATLLGQAVYDGDTAKVQDLIKKGASIEKSFTDETYVYDILYTALRVNKVEMLRYILKNKLYTSVNATYTEDAETPLTLACNIDNEKDAMEIADSLIVLGANVNGAGVTGGERILYPLIIAVGHKNAALTKLLVDHGANKEIKNENGETPIVFAQKKGFEDIVNILK